MPPHTVSRSPHVGVLRSSLGMLTALTPEHASERLAQARVPRGGSPRVCGMSAGSPGRLHPSATVPYQRCFAHALNSHAFRLTF
eukprot:scaffold51507_cov63-Phaeocystis_antarctica.AAC.1